MPESAGPPREPFLTVVVALVRRISATIVHALVRLVNGVLGAARRSFVQIRAAVSLATGRMRRVDRRMALGAVALVVLVTVITVALAVARSGSGTRSADDDSTTPTAPEAVASDPIGGGPFVAFPAPVGGSQAAEPPVRPVGVRDLEVGFEAAVVADVRSPSCSEREVDLERVVWFDLPLETAGDGLAAVVPGEHGTAVLLAGAALDSLPAPLMGLERVRVGSLVEVARENGTVLFWRVLDVVDVPAGTPFPTSLLEQAPEQRLVLVGCDAQVDGRARDVYVLALRAR